MRSRSRKKGRGFFCIGAGAVGVREMEAMQRRSGNSSGGRDESSLVEQRSRRWGSFPRGLVKIFTSLALLSSPSRSGKERRDSNRLLKQKEAESMEKSTDFDDDRRVLALFSSSSSFSPSSSSTSSSYSLPSVSRSPETKEQRKMVAEEANKPQPLAPVRTMNYRSAIRTFLFLSSLTLLVFYGRLCTILWISSWFCYAARRNRAAVA